MYCSLQLGLGFVRFKAGLSECLTFIMSNIFYKSRFDLVWVRVLERSASSSGVVWVEFELCEMLLYFLLNAR